MEEDVNKRYARCRLEGGVRVASWIRNVAAGVAVTSFIVGAVSFYNGFSYSRKADGSHSIKLSGNACGYYPAFVAGTLLYLCGRSVVEANKNALSRLEEEIDDDKLKLS